MGFSLGGLGGVISSGINYFSAKDTNRQQKKLAREQMAFQERLSNTAYQRAVKDMRAAGINPMLAYAQGGASSPSGAMAQLKVPSVGDTAIKGLDVGSKTTQRKLQNENIKEQNSLIAAQREQAIAQANSARAVTAYTAGQAKQSNVTGDFYVKHPELAPSLQLGGGAGAAASGASSLMRILKGAM